MGWRRPDALLTQNGELRAEGIWNWTLPAWAGRLPDGRTYNTCPSAGVCRRACYALNGTYRFPGVLARHEANLAYVLDDLPGWQRQMLDETGHRRHREGWVRVHDSGDYFSDAYLVAWLEIAWQRPAVTFYSYTKEVERFRRLVEVGPPPNFRWVYSLGGRQDHTLDPARDRMADVFPDEAAIAAAGWSSQDGSDLLAVTGPRRVGIPSNNIPRYRRLLDGRTFGDWQAQERAQHAARRP